MSTSKTRLVPASMDMNLIDLLNAIGLNQDQTDEVIKASGKIMLDETVTTPLDFFNRLRDMVPDENVRNCVIWSMAGYIEKNFIESELPLPIDVLRGIQVLDMRDMETLQNIPHGQA